MIRAIKYFFTTALLLLAVVGCDKKDDGHDWQPVSEPEVIVAPVAGGNRSGHIGINKYPGAGLDGCVNDCQDMSMLAQEHGILNQRVLTDENATAEACLELIRWVCADAKAGDVRLITFSGHGAQYAGVGSEDEPDRLDEVLCPVDFDWSPEHMITDDQLYQIFSKVPAGVSLWFLSDSCHSGDLLRDGKKPRKYPNVPDAIKARLNDAKRVLPRLQELNIGYGSGCRSDQTSADTQDENGRACGAFTNEFKKAEKASGQKVFKTVIADTRNALKATGYSQAPQAEGKNADKRFLMPIVKPVPVPEIKRRSDAKGHWAGDRTHC